MEQLICSEAQKHAMLGYLSKGLAEQHYDAIVADSYYDCAKYAAQHTTLIYAVPYALVKQIVLGLPGMAHTMQAHIYETKICLIVHYGDGPTTNKIECFYGKLEFPPFNDASELIKFADTAYWRWGSMIVHGSSGEGTIIFEPNSSNTVNKLRQYSKRYYDFLEEGNEYGRIIVALQPIDWDLLCPDGYENEAINEDEEQEEHSYQHEGMIIYNENGYIVREFNGRRELLFQSNPTQVQAWISITTLPSIAEYHKPIIESITQPMSTILLLGGGIGNLSNQIINKHPNVCITNIELDKNVVEIGKKYFSLTENEHCKFIIDDAQHYVDHCTVKYDVVIIDINGSAPFENSPPKCIYSNPNLLKICDMLLVNYVNRYDMEFQPIFPYMKVVQIKDYYNEMVIQAKHSIDSV